MKSIQVLLLSGLLFFGIACSTNLKHIQKDKNNDSTSVQKPTKDKPNVLFILADDLGINALNCYGNDLVESPNIDKLFDEGMHFTNGYSNDPTCAPSRASIMSGQYVPRHRVYRVANRYLKQKGTLENMKFLPPKNYTLKGSGTGLPLEKVTLGEAFQQNGYLTSAYGKWHLGKKDLGISNQGFDEGYEITKHYHFDTSPHQDIDNSGYGSDLVTENTKKFITKAVKEGKPFFSYVPYYLVHKPLEPKPEALAHFKEKLKNNKDVGPNEVKVLAMIKCLDDEVGELLAHLKKLGIEDNTIIVFASDNGHYRTESNIFNQPYRGVKGQTFEGGIRVPYIFKWPGQIQKKSKSVEPIIHVDLYPTLLGLTHSKLPEKYILDGVDLSPILLNKEDKTKRDALVWEYTNYARYNPKTHKFASEWVNVIQMDGFKLTEVIETGEYYMYNLNNDPYETKDIYKEYPEQAEKMIARLERWKKDTGYEYPKPNPDYEGQIKNKDHDVKKTSIKKIKEKKNKIKKQQKQKKQPIDEIQTYEVDESIKVQTASKKAQEAWRDNKFGMFIHWGPISQLGIPLSHGRHSESHIPGNKPYKPKNDVTIEPAEYDIQYKTFNPTKFDPDYIIKLAKNAGMKYLVFTAKHHAGFSMFDSKVTDYDIMSAPYHKDILKELEQACRRQNFEFGFYYSPRDWKHPDCNSLNHHDRYIEFYKAQMDELLHNYGSIYEIWFDGLGPGNWGNTSEQIMKKIRKLHPDAMVNDRGGVGADFYTPEHTISQLNNDDNWEACHTITSQWGYNPNAKVKSLKQLMEILLYTWGGGGNMLLNIGPRGDGSLNPVEEKRLKQIAKWWKVNGETSIRGTRGGPYYPGNWGVSTKKNNKVYLHIFRWPKEKNEMDFPNLPGLTLEKVRLLNGKNIDFRQNKDIFTIIVSPENREKIVTTIELTFDKNVMNADPVYAIIPLTHHAKITASQNQKDVKNLLDGDARTTWLADKKQGEIWLEVEFDQETTIESIVLGRGDHWNPKNKPEIQIPDGKGGWKKVFSWKPKWETVKFLKKPIKTKKLRILVKGTKTYNLAEFELYGAL